MGRRKRSVKNPLEHDAPAMSAADLRALDDALGLPAHIVAPEIPCHRTTLARMLTGAMTIQPRNVPAIRRAYARLARRYGKLKEA